VAFVRKYWWLFLLLGIAFMASPITNNPVSRFFRQIFLRGGKVNSRWPYNEATGCVDASPESLASEAGVDLDTFALATMISSEHGNDPQVYKEAIGSAALNEAKARKVRISALLLKATDSNHSGKFGAQANMERTLAGGGRPSDRYASTARAPYEDDLAIASLLVNGFTPDFTEGARQYDSPKAQDAGYKKGLYSLNAEALAAKRIGEGKIEVNPEGIDPQRLRFWRQA
jgi:hypothetical protein